MRNGKLRGLLITVMLLVFLAGLASILYPYIWGAAVDSSIASIAKDFLEREEPELERLDSKTWKIRGTCSLHDVAKALDHEFSDAEEYETFSGFLIGKLGEIPKDGSRLKLEIEGYLIRILNVRQHCVEKAIVRLEHSPANPL